MKITKQLRNFRKSQDFKKKLKIQNFQKTSKISGHIENLNDFKNSKNFKNV